MCGKLNRKSQKLSALSKIYQLHLFIMENFYPRLYETLNYLKTIIGNIQINKNIKNVSEYLMKW